ncbi:DUF4381 domain-containing protein [Rhizobium sp. CCGE 510]|uniref:DUF4381 domain-containing protein n=1 Tax=Rhizobium sp. CCGE 510 TaxID=1132836 RepID=UPI00027B8914|nr:DUF4381 domain-containing protein [Rhizobium sp. CCGE 510]EJT01970.1 hypothetical protein RCCGE510_25746 [Rhizobium sp. CCGE 510]
METDAPSLDPMTATALRTMKDIVLPSPVSWLPQTWGWLAAASVAVLALATWVAFAILRYRRNAYRREALKLLDGIEQRLRSATSRQAALQDLGVLLKRVAIKTWGREKVARLSGNEWSNFLTEHGRPGGRPLLSEMADDIEYRDATFLERLPDDLGDDLAEDARRWIGGHHV